MSAPAFVLVHSPLVGPLTWRSVAAELRRRGYAAVVPDLRASETPDPPYWRQHVAAAVAALDGTDATRSLILVGHSGGGVLLPAIAAAAGRPVAAYLFVDADLPHDGQSRLGRFADPADAAAFRAAATGGLIPTWTEDDLAEVIPDPALRRAFVAELHPLPLAVYDEPIPVPASWPEAPGGYLQFSPPYDAAAAEARALGWPLIAMPSGHFQMLVDPAAVTHALLDLLARLGVDRAPAKDTVDV
jgi:alpha-beta hydrolase superfamily lysophospholipase